MLFARSFLYHMFMLCQKVNKVSVKMSVSLNFGLGMFILDQCVAPHRSAQAHEGNKINLSTQFLSHAPAAAVVIMLL